MSEWRDVPLSALYRRVARRDAPDEELLSVYRDHGVVPKASRDDNFNKPSEDLSPYLLVEPGDLVVNKMKAWQGSVAVSDYRGIVSPAYFVYARIGDVQSRFAHYLLRSAGMIARYRSISGGIRPSQWDLDPMAFKKLRLLLPGNAGQRAIADYLDRETAQIDALIAKQEQLIETLRERRVMQIFRAVTGKGHGGPTQDGPDWAGAVPSHWEVKRLKFSVESSETGTWGAEPLDDGSDVVCVRVADFDRPRLRVGLAETRRQVPESDVARKSLRAGDLLLEKSGGTERNPVGFVVLFTGFDEPAVTSNFITRLRLTPGQLPAYWLYAHAASYSTHLTARSVKRTTGISNLDQASYFDELFPYPPPEEQHRIVAELDAQTAQIDELIGKAKQFIALAKERRAALITAAVTGQIAVPGFDPAADPTDETTKAA